MKTFSPELFDVENSDQWKNYLEENGFVVLRNILQKETMIKYFKLFAKDWKYVSPNFDFHNKETWTPTNSPMMWNKGMIYWNGLSHSDFMWSLRTDDNILDIWHRLHNTKKLVASFDAFSVYLSNKQKSKPWLHTDQSFDSELYSIQGAYNFLPVTENSSGFVVVPKSHKTYKIMKKSKTNFSQIGDTDLHNQLAVKLIIPENCFVLWNSKTIHANVGMSEKKKIYDFNRLTCYLTYFPKTLRGEDVFGKRVDGYKNGISCSHFAIHYRPKQHSYGVKNVYESRNFNFIKKDDNIPKEIFDLI
jgi:ectoine hydroxylase-related dioxygenase (phytanoyl-CoA dioxygenase family)